MITSVLATFGFAAIIFNSIQALRGTDEKSARMVTHTTALLALVLIISEYAYIAHQMPETFGFLSNAEARTIRPGADPSRPYDLFTTSLLIIGLGIQCIVVTPRLLGVVSAPLTLEEALNQFLAPSMYLIYSYQRWHTKLDETVERFFLFVSMLCSFFSLLINRLKASGFPAFLTSRFSAIIAERAVLEKFDPAPLNQEESDGELDSSDLSLRRRISESRIPTSKPPLKPTEPQKRWYSDAQFGTKGGDASILLASTCKGLCDRYRLLASKYRCSLSIATSSLPVHSLLALYHFHAFIIDLELPDINQIHLRDIEAQLARSGYPVVIVALIPQSLEAMKDAILQSGMSSVITKESNMEESDFKRLVETAKNSVAVQGSTLPAAQQMALINGRSQSTSSLLAGKPPGQFVSRFPRGGTKKDSVGQTLRTITKTNLVSSVAEEALKLEGLLGTEAQRQAFNTLRTHLEQLSVYKRMFDSVVPPQFQQLISPLGMQKLVVGAHVVKGVTVLFTDIRDFSGFAEKVDSQAMIDFFNEYLSFAMPPITNNNGFIDKFIGDSIMCIFAESSHASDAVKCSIEIAKDLEYRSSLPGFTRCDTGIGINSGSCTVGLVGTESRMQPTVLGDTVNLASRTESLCKKYGAKILITGETFGQIKRADLVCWVVRQIDHVCVMGKQKPTDIYEIIDGECNPQIFKLKKMITEEHWTVALDLFKVKKFQQALTRFQKCMLIYPDDIPTKLYLERCVEMLLAPPEAVDSWTFVYELKSK